MTIIQLMYFASLAEVGSFTAAARECRVAQPSLSQQIAKLEAELGYALFDRTGRKISLTEAGRFLLPRAKSILSQVEDAEKFFARGIDEQQGHLSIGAIPTMAPYILPQVIEKFTAEYPDVTISITEDLTANLLRKLNERDLDAAIMSTPLPAGVVSFKVMAREPFLVATADGSELASVSRISLSRLRQRPFILLSQMHCLGQQISEFCHISRIAERITCESSQLSTVQEFVRMNLGFSLLPRMCALADQSPGISYKPLEHNPVEREIALAWPSGSGQSATLKNFTKYLEVVLLKDMKLKKP